LLHPRASFANVMSCLALFVALGGASYAAVSLPTNSVGAKQIKNASIDNTKVKQGSLLKSSFKRGQLPAGAKGAKGAKGAIGLQGATGLAGAIKLGSFTHHVAQDVPGDSQWHNFVATTFTSAANTIYVPNDYSDFLNTSLTGTGCGDVQTLFSRTVVNGVNVSPVDNNGNSYQPQFLGPYPAGTSVAVEMQYKLSCATQTWHSPAGDLAMVPYQTS
jgi:hypothetical protein